MQQSLSVGHQTHGKPFQMVDQVAGAILQTQSSSPVVFAVLPACIPQACGGVGASNNRQSIVWLHVHCDASLDSLAAVQYHYESPHLPSIKKKIRTVDVLMRLYAQ